MKFLYRHGKLSLALLFTITFLLIYLTNTYVLTTGFYEANGDPLAATPAQGAIIYEALQKWVYLSSAAYLLIKIGVIALILHTALFLQDLEVPFRRIVKIVVLAEFTFLIPAFIKLVSFNYTFQHGNLLDWHKYYILSALSIAGEVPADWYYTLQTLNLFEVTYWFILAYGISKITQKPFDESLRTVVCSYVPGLFLWVVAVTFFTLMMFPTAG
ncbi:hypothetical protein ACFQZI_06620 [Mucilaginibacter lutimaris]|uniref:Yip1 domain-containing protein n=1 Tax=Mucilaginibacter lutimaris TaxID=931629 RepID=A0ABW2ZEC0_9SPHI